MSYLEAKGHQTRLAPYGPDADDRVVRAALESAPRLIGFSIIFQYNLDEFGNLMASLRRAGVRAHFTAGGHYPSLCPERTMSALPELDSVVRFEGEITAEELLQNVDLPENWPAIQGLVFRRGSEIVINPARPLVDDLDSLAVARARKHSPGGPRHSDGSDAGKSRLSVQLLVLQHPPVLQRSARPEPPGEISRGCRRRNESSVRQPRRAAVPVPG